MVETFSKIFCDFGPPKLSRKCPKLFRETKVRNPCPKILVIFVIFENSGQILVKNSFDRISVPEHARPFLSVFLDSTFLGVFLVCSTGKYRKITKITSISKISKISDIDSPVSDRGFEP